MPLFTSVPSAPTPTPTPTPTRTPAAVPARLGTDLEPRDGKPPVLYAHPHALESAPGWAAEHRHTLRGLVTEHGALLVRGLGLRDTGQAGAVFQQLAPGLMTEMLVDNVRTAHSREPFEPPRDVVVALAEPLTGQLHAVDDFLHELRRPG